MYLLTTPSEVDALREHVCFENISRNECVVTFITNKTPYQVYNTCALQCIELVYFENASWGGYFATLVTI